MELAVALLVGGLALTELRTVEPRFGPERDLAWPVSVAALVFARRFPVPAAVIVGLAELADRADLGLWSVGAYFYATVWLVAKRRDTLVSGAVLVLTTVGFVSPWELGFYTADPVPRIIVAVMAPVAAVATGALIRYRTALIESYAEQARLAERERAAVVAQIRAEERTQLAAELHDSVGHEISLIAVRAGALTAAPPDRAQAKAVGAEIRGLARDALAELRQIVKVLYEGGAAATGRLFTLTDLPGLLAGVSDAGLEVSLTMSGPAVSIPAAVERAAYRIIQEALTNVLKHAPGAVTAVTVRRAADRLELSITNGPAAPHPPLTTGTGFGLRGLRARTKQLAGTFHAGPTSGGGFEVRVSLPLGTT